LFTVKSSPAVVFALATAHVSLVKSLLSRRVNILRYQSTITCILLVMTCCDGIFKLLQKTFHHPRDNNKNHHRRVPHFV